jgi:uncharacterized tellurite resistance protein B-like protein
MFDSLQKFISGALAPSDDQATEAGRLRLATCVLLLEVAHADDEFDPAEQELVTGMIRRRFGLDDGEAAALLAAADDERRRSGDLYRFARELNDGFSRERKLAVVELLWRIVYSDGVLEAHEDAIMRKLGTVLGLRRDDVIALKLKARNGPA